MKKTQKKQKTKPEPISLAPLKTEQVIDALLKTKQTKSPARPPKQTDKD